MTDQKDKVGSRDFLYDYLDPMQKFSVLKEVKPKDPIEEIVNKIFDDVEYSDFDDLKKMIGDIGYMTQVDDLKDFHGIGPDKLLFDNDEYLKAKKVTDSSCMINKVGPNSQSVLSGKKLAVFSTRHPFITPAFRNTKEIDFFLNYTPSIFASQMVPYLDVEFQINRDAVAYDVNAEPEKREAINATNVTSPSIIRFLMGSVNTLALKGADAALELGRLVEGAGRTAESVGSEETKHWLDPTTAYSGMEMFMMPQMLTNFDELNESPTRMNTVKPFLPFASIEAFDITLANAGAGLISHKSGVLRLKIHDKARLPEFSQFIRGSVGFATARIITTYGWRAPEGRGPDEIYSEFINKKMTVRDRWMIVNTSFSFDVMGQVTLTLQINAAGMSEIQGAEVSENAYLQDVYLRLANVTKTLKDFSDKLAQRSSMSADVSFVQVLQGAADRSFAGAATDPKVREAVQKAQRIISKFGDKLGYSPADRLSTSHALNEFTKKTGSNISTELLSGAIKASFERFREALVGAIDPFLPDIESNTNNSKITQDYFSQEYIQLLKGTNPVDSNLSVKLQKDTLLGVQPITEDLRREIATQAGQAKFENDSAAARAHNSTNDRIKVQLPTSSQEYITTARLASLETSLEKQKGVADELHLTGNNRNVASFGLIFTRFVAEAIFHKNTCSELQIFFYSLNNNCGPVSGQSIAEFPLDLDKLMSVYAKFLRVNDTITVEAFLAMIMQTQFTDNRHFAYAMGPAYKPWTPDPGDQLAKDEKTYDTFMLNYHIKYPNFTSPQIELYVESGADLGKDLETSERDRKNVGGSKITKRIHVYDKTCNPRELISNIIQTNDHVLLGATATGGDSHQGRKVSTDRLRISMQNKIDKMVKDMSKRSGVPADQIQPPTTVVAVPGAYKAKKGSARELLNIVSSMLPAIRPGTNGSLVTTATMASKTNSLATSGNMVQQLKGFTGGQGGVLPPANGFEDPNNQPLRTYPAQLTMQTVGCPIANLYQQFYIDFGTGTTLDNLYFVTAIKHSITPGQFKTDMTFVPNDAYGKLAGGAVIKATLQQVLDDIGKNDMLKEWEAQWNRDHPPPAPMLPRPPSPPDTPVGQPPIKPTLTDAEARNITYYNKVHPPADFTFCAGSTGYWAGAKEALKYILPGETLQDQWRTSRFEFWAKHGNPFPGWQVDNRVARAGDPVQYQGG